LTGPTLLEMSGLRVYQDLADDTARVADSPISFPKCAASRGEMVRLVLKLGSRKPMTKSGVATMLAGLGLLIPASVGLLVSGVPTILCPFPLVTILSAFLLHGQGSLKAAVAVPTLLFFAWHPGLFRGDAKIPKRSYVLLIVLILLSIADFIAGWNWGLQYQGPQYTHAVCAINVAWAVFLLLAFARSWKKPPSFVYSLFLHWMLFAWLAWYAFPYLGELP
jgi:hypothetical protein